MPHLSSARPHFVVRSTRNKPCSLLLIAAAIGATQAIPASAQDAGALQKQIEQDLKTAPAPREDLKPKAAPALGAARPDAVTVTVQRFEFRGNTRLETAQLQALVAPYLNQTLDFDQLKRIAELVGDAYRQAGWIVRVYLPAQDIRDGVVTLEIVEATFGKPVIRGTQSRVAPGFIERMVTSAQPAGEPVQTRRIDRALLLLGDLPGVSAAGNLVEGAQPGETDLIVGVNDAARFSGSVAADNAGARSTGTNRAVASVAVNGPLRLGDQFTATGLKSRGAEYARLGYSLPVGYDGLLVGGNVTRLTYGLIGEFANLNGNGSAHSSGLTVSYPWLRSPLTSLYVTTAYDAKRFDNLANGTTSSNYRIDVYNVGLYGNHSDGWAGGGYTTASLNVVRGRVDLDGSPNRGSDASGPATAGGYTRVSLGLQRLQNVATDLSAFVALNVQRANRNLDSSERLYLGGSNGVRAYPTSEGGGSEGYTLTAELRRKLGNVTLTGFYDYGRVTAYKTNAYADGSGRLNAGAYPNVYALSGYGASAAWQANKATTLRATFARRLGTSPIANPTTGLDGDGSKTLNRFWVNAAYAF